MKHMRCEVPQLIIHNAAVHTLDGADTVAQAIAVSAYSLTLAASVNALRL